MQQKARVRDAQPAVAPEQGEATALIAEVLTDGNAHAAEMQRHALETAAAFRAGGERRALGHYIELLGGFDLLVKTLDGAGRALGVDFAATVVGDTTLARFVEDLNALLTESMKAQERKDWVLLADLLEYELAPHLEAWQQVFAALSARVPSAR
ncbi:hypothetical protein [Geobacter pickeringii]|uniref:hypothetical protein n=1 Tax=Geobacter pickeringii TaxID=345632 RepID=UPI0006925C1F|nr:hypothetical protein [Geobacter pickeringii]